MKYELNKISDYVWEIPIEAKTGMRVPARIYLKENMLDMLFRDRSLDQLTNVATLPGIQGKVVLMPDAHEGYGFPIGAAAAVDLSEGVISPGGIGYDINCGVRLMKTQMSREQVSPKIKELAREIFRNVPTGVGKSGSVKLGEKDMDAVLNRGCEWAQNRGYAEGDDLKCIESFGSLDTADSKAVSQKAKARGRDQLGTMGAGNHFVEIDLVERIYDGVAATAFGLREGQIVAQIHTGSRGLGHQVATDYVRRMGGAVKKYGYDLPDRELACAPFRSNEGEEYFAAMSAAANFAWTNRQLIAHRLRESFRKVFGAGTDLDLLYDVAHNIAKIEEHEIDGVMKKLIVHRKGATRAFPPLHPDVTPKYRPVGQPVLIPGSMGTASYVLVGRQKAMENCFGTTCHGAGRTMSRSKARKKIFGKDLRIELEKSGIEIQAGSMKGLAEEAPAAYKDVEGVVDTVDKAGIAGKVARLIPLAVVKG